MNDSSGSSAILGVIVGVLIVGGSENACFDRDGRCSAYYNGGIGPNFTPA